MTPQCVWQVHTQLKDLRNEPDNPKTTTGPLLAPQYTPLNEPYQFALEQDYGDPKESGILNSQR